MIKLLKKNLLPTTVFITGACVLIVEVVAVRALSPYFGNTIYSVSSVISVILAALSIGYYAGGKVADRNPSINLFFGIILVSGLLVITLHFFGIFILPIVSLNLSLINGPLVASFLLFFIPALLLGTLSPFAVKLQSMQKPKIGIGSVSGNIFFWSTLGSIVGSLLAGFVLIPRFGIDRIFITTGILLFLLGIIPLMSFGADKKRLFKSFLAVVILTFFTLLSIRQIKGDVLYQKDGVYEKLTIYDGEFEGRKTRFFLQDRSSSAAMFLDTEDPTDLVFEYTKYYSLYKIFRPDVKNALVIGGGAYSIPKALSAQLPEAHIDVSEIEPATYELSKEYFNLKDNSNIENHVLDGRRFLRDADKEYDLIFSDVYYSLYSIPAHFTTREFFTIAKAKLSADGVFIANLVGDISRQLPSLIFSEINTFRSVFPNSFFFATDSPTTIEPQNIIFIGYNSSKKINLESKLIMENESPVINSLKDKEINLQRYDLSAYPVLTDNYAPVEYLTAKVLKHSVNTKSLNAGGEMLALIKQQLDYGPRYMGTTGHVNIQNLLIAEMKDLTASSIIQSWDYRASDGNTYKLKNIIGRINPVNERRIILATHYDSKRFADLDPTHKDQPVPGANDSASGVAVLLDLARILSTSPEIPDIGIDFVFFDGEEGDINQKSDYTNWKPLGSTYFADHLNELYNNKPISAVVLDMVCDKNLIVYKELTSAENSSQQTEAFWNIAKKVYSRVFRDQIKFGIQDDHTALISAGIPAFLIIDFDYPYFHTTRDTVDKCSSESLKTVAESVYNYLYTLD